MPAPLIKHMGRMVFLRGPRAYTNVVRAALFSGGHTVATIRKTVGFANSVKLLKDRMNVLGTAINRAAPKSNVFVNREFFIPGKFLNKFAPKQGSQLFREVVAHENFHANAPAGLGRSEALAHLYGGFKSVKQNKIRQAAKSLRHLWRSRPARASIEAGIATVGTVGAVKTGRVVYRRIHGRVVPIKRSA